MEQDKAVASAAFGQKRPSRFFGQFIIKNRLQFKFAGMIFLFLAAASVTIWVEGRWAINRMVQTGIIENQEAINHLHYLTQLVGYTSLLALAITFLLSLFFSHYVAGPIYRFERTLEQMREGNLNIHVRLRKNDELKDTADLFNQALASLRHKLFKEREMVNEKLNEVSESLKKDSQKKHSSKIDQIVFDLNNTSSKIKI